MIVTDKDGKVVDKKIKLKMTPAIEKIQWQKSEE